MKLYLQTLFTVIIFALLLSGCKQKKPVPSEEAFLGEWYTVKGGLEAYSFLKDSNNYIFVGTRDMRPVVYGTWKIVKNKFVITMDSGTSTTYTFVLSNDTLIFNGGSEIYTRRASLEVKYPEARVLASISSDLSSLKFSAPRPADLNWDFRADSIRAPQHYSLKGYSISAVTILSSDAITEISNYLKDYGFEQDTLSVNKTCSGFRDDNQIVTICTHQDPAIKNDSIYIQITSGLILK